MDVVTQRGAVIDTKQAVFSALIASRRHLHLCKMAGFFNANQLAMSLQKDFYTGPIVVPCAAVQDKLYDE
jgi:hypothetical protein